MTLNVVLHAGTLLAILIYYFKKLLAILLEKRRRRLIALVIVGSVPAAILGGGMKVTGLDSMLFSSPWTAAVGFLITATVLLVTFNWPWRKGREDGTIELENMSYKQSILIGCAQAIAIAPGISRSGSTISAAVLSKLRKADAAEFSFLLAIPAIGGAALLELIDLLKEGSSSFSGDMWLNYLVGLAVSAIVGYAALAGLIAMLRRGKLGWFSCYLILAAIVVVVVQVCKLF
jgi:undecaprenyl-diphosphatase